MSQDAIFYPPKAKTGAALWFTMILSAGVALLVLWLCVYTLWGAATLSYDVTPENVTITFGWKNVTIPREEIIDVTIIDKPTRARRHAGTSLPGLYEGRWSFAETGRLILFATSTRPLTVIETSETTWGISPADPAGFQQAVKSEGFGEFPPVPGGNRNGLTITLGTALLFVLSIPVILVTYFIRVSRRLRYELADEGLIVYGAWRSIFIPYDHINDVRIANPDGRPWRTFGTSAPGLYWGSFSWRNAGPNLRLYATRLRPIVLMSLGNRTIGVTPGDNERFVAELTRRLPHRVC